MKISKTRIIAFIIIAAMSFIISITKSTTATLEEVYQQNLKIYNSQGMDPVTLAYYLLPQNYIQSDDKNIIELANFITKGLSKDYDKAKAIHDKVAETLYYDWDMYHSKDYKNISAFDAARYTNALCEGYINLTVALLRASGIPAKYISGYTTRNVRENHAWCEAFVDGRWIIIDTTWDSKNTYENGKFKKDTPCDDAYFDISLKDFSVGHEYKDYSYVGIGAFRGCKNLKSITIPNGFTAVEDIAFRDCENLTSVKIPDSVIKIGWAAFYNCANLKSIIIPRNVRTIRDSAFAGCKNLTIYGERGSAAENYAKKNNIKFVEKIPDKTEEEKTVAIQDNLNPLAAFSLSPSATHKIGDILGDVLYSDITAYINGYAIPTSVIKGITLVVVEDLAKYGFNVSWNSKGRTLNVTLNKSKKFEPLKVVKDTTHKPGTFKCKYLYTDIKTYISGELVESFAINGVTLIDFELLAKYGKLNWNGGKREIRLTIN